MKFNVTKSIVVNAPYENVRPLIEDFNYWNSWSPWVVLEPECKVTVEGDVNQPGHSMRWDGELIGAGQNIIRESSPERIDYNLEFFKPWKSKADVSFVLEPSDGQTKVTWTMDSSMPFFLFFMIKSIKTFVGMDYERGLKMIKAIAEEGSLDCETINSDTMDYKGFSYRGIQRTVAISDMPETMSKDFEKIVNDIVIQGNKAAEHWICVYPKFDLKKGVATYIAAVSDENLDDLELDSHYVSGSVPSGKALEIKHNGSYEFLGNAWAMGMMNMQSKKLKGKDYPFEQYWNSPTEVKPNELKTSVFFPLKN